MQSPNPKNEFNGDFRLSIREKVVGGVLILAQASVANPFCWSCIKADEMRFLIYLFSPWNIWNALSHVFLATFFQTSYYKLFYFNFYALFHLCFFLILLSLLDLPLVPPTISILLTLSSHPLSTLYYAISITSLFPSLFFSDNLIAHLIFLCAFWS